MLNIYYYTQAALKALIRVRDVRLPELELQSFLIYEQFTIKCRNDYCQMH